MSVRTVRHEVFGTAFPGGRYAEFVPPTKANRCAIRDSGTWDVEIGVFSSREALARLVRKQEMQPCSRLHWRPIEALKQGEGF